MHDLQEIESIKRLKYKYLRCLDLKLWDELSQCFTEDATAAYADGKFSFSGRDEIMKFLIGAMSSPTVLSAHRVHHPEIELTGPTTAKGVWMLKDTFTALDAKMTVRGAGHYHDEYVKVGGEWKIKSTGYERMYEEVERRGEAIQVTANRFEK